MKRTLSGLGLQAVAQMPNDTTHDTPFIVGFGPNGWNHDSSNFQLDRRQCLKFSAML